MHKLYYYKLKEAEELRQTYVSWIGKKAHVGNGITSVLKTISVKPKRHFSPLKKQKELYRILFEFDGGYKLNTYEFLFHNSLIHPAKARDINHRDQSSAA
jgi:hypothetical protein